MEIGENIRKFRNRKGLTQKELAKELDLTSVTIQNYENNRRKPDFEVLDKITAVLDCTLSDLLGIDSSKENNKVNSQSYYLEQYLRTLGYEIIFDMENVYLILKSKDSEYEITEKDIEDLKNSTRSFIEFKLHEITNRARKIGE